MQDTAPSISAEVRGNASRLVIRKYFGKVPKRSHTKGAVNTWQEMLKAIDDHIRCTGPLTRPLTGNQASIRGNKVNIPSMAR